MRSILAGLSSFNICQWLASICALPMLSKFIGIRHPWGIKKISSASSKYRHTSSLTVLITMDAQQNNKCKLLWQSQPRSSTLCSSLDIKPQGCHNSSSSTSSIGQERSRGLVESGDIVETADAASSAHGEVCRLFVIRLSLAILYHR